MDKINNLIDEIIDGYSRSEGEERADAEVEETEGGESSAEELRSEERRVGKEC